MFVNKNNVFFYKILVISIDLLLFLCFKASEKCVNFAVMRPAETQEEAGGSREGQHSRGARRAPELQYFRRHSTYLKVM